MMLLKQADDKSTHIDELEQLLTVIPANRKNEVEQELRILRAGLKGEQESAYLIDFHMGKSKNTAIIHDLRLKVGDRVAQIDHLLIHRTLNVFVLETKHFHAGMKITEDGEFLRWNQFKKSYEGMASPLAQNERHIAVLKEVFDQIEMPKRLRMRLAPVFHSYILISPSARIDRPKKFDTSHIIKADMIGKTIDTKFEKEGVLDTLGGMARLVSKETVEEIGRQLVALHQPLNVDYSAKFNVQQQKGTEDQLQCRACKSVNISIQYGKYGYYIKCRDCEGNTPIHIGCGQPGHKERIRKDGLNFYRECAECQTSSLYFVNSN